MRLYFTRNPHLVYIMPAIIILLVLTIFPAILLVLLSITDYELGASSFKVVWLENYNRLSTSPEFWNSLKITLFFALITTSVELVLGYFLATLLDREIKLKFLVFACLIVPIAMTPSIAGQIWKLILNADYGIMNHLFDKILGFEVSWLSQSNALMSTILVDIWQFTPFVTLILYAGLRSLPEDPYEAATMDGANRFQLFRYITLPLLRPIILLAVLFRLIDSLRIFDIPFSLTEGGPGNATEFLSLFIYRLGFAETGWLGRSSATAVILLVLIIAISFLLINLLKERKDDTI